MCLVALALEASPRYPLVLAANRDEFFARPADGLGWWSPGPGLPDILSGRDLESGGTWLGLTAAGRLALLTNVREPQRHVPDAPSRGGIVPLWLAGQMTVDRYWARTNAGGHNGFNVIAADFRAGDCVYLSNRAEAPEPLARGVYGLSNAGLDTPWPKVERLKAALHDALAEAASPDALCERLFQALADRHIPPDDALPTTGLPLPRERLVAPAFIRTPDGVYGTRCSTVVVTERVGGRPVTTVRERSFGADGDVQGVREVRLEDWPPER